MNEALSPGLIREHEQRRLPLRRHAHAHLTAAPMRSADGGTAPSTFAATSPMRTGRRRRQRLLETSRKSSSSLHRALQRARRVRTGRARPTCSRPSTGSPPCARSARRGPKELLRFGTEATRVRRRGRSHRGPHPPPRRAPGRAPAARARCKRERKPCQDPRPTSAPWPWSCSPRTTSASCAALARWIAAPSSIGRSSPDPRGATWRTCRPTAARWRPATRPCAPATTRCPARRPIEGDPRPPRRSS
jgi:hypothetical protein